MAAATMPATFKLEMLSSVTFCHRSHKNVPNIKCRIRHPKEPQFWWPLACQLHITDSFTLWAWKEAMRRRAVYAAAVEIDRAI